MEATQPAHAKKRRKACGAFNHYADGSGEWVRAVYGSIFHCVCTHLWSSASQHLRTSTELHGLWQHVQTCMDLWVLCRECLAAWCLPLQACLLPYACRVLGSGCMPACSDLHGGSGAELHSRVDG